VNVKVQIIVFFVKIIIHNREKIVFKKHIKNSRFTYFSAARLNLYVLYIYKYVLSISLYFIVNYETFLTCINSVGYRMYT